MGDRKSIFKDEIDQEYKLLRKNYNNKKSDNLISLDTARQNKFTCDWDRYIPTKPTFEGVKFFENIPTIRDKLLTLQKVGLGYMSIGQQATTLSGGEAQRIKLAKELSKRSTGRTIYILDEPTTGLHVHDVKKLLEVLQAFVQKGNTVVVIEHNMEVIKTADWIIDMGPDGGDKGGNIVFEGTPEQLLNIKESYTGKFLKKILSKKIKF
jgi:excinuclease ABC subunit A